MLNLILSGSQYIYQNLIKNIWFPAVTWKARVLHGAHQNSRHSDSCPDSAGRAAPGPAPSAGLRPSRARSPRPRAILHGRGTHTPGFFTRRSPSGLGSWRQNIRVYPRLPSWVPPLGIAPGARPQQLIWAPFNIFGFSPPLNIHAIGNVYMK